MVFFLVLGNSAIASQLTGVEWRLWEFLIGYFVALSFFFRLRCFDEIKDYQVDLKVNPHRPLARGLLTISEVRAMFLSLTVFELAVALSLSFAVFVVHSLAVIYSYVMYREFFIGKYIAQHLTTYAVLHTFVSVLVGYSIISISSGLMFSEFTDALLTFGLVNWALFNLFEFARKTYSPDEERVGVATYSSQFGAWGAGFLSLSQIACALVVLAAVGFRAGESVWLLTGIGYVHYVAAACVMLATIFYALLPTSSRAKVFRSICAAYLLIFYAILSVQTFFS